MPRVSLKCSKCSRKFKMPAHLARHMNTIHASAASKAKSKAARKSKGKRPVGRPRATAAGRPAGTTVARSNMADAASRLLNDMQAFHSDLLSQRNSLDSEIDSLARAMEAFGGSVGATRKQGKRKVGRPAGSGRPRGAAPREGSLKSFIVRVLKQNSKPLSPNDIGARVVKAGFKTKAKDITKAVSNTLPQLGNIKRIGFGMYKLGR